MNLIKPFNTYAILKDWWEKINLTNYEKSVFNADIISFNQQLIRLKQRKIRIGVVGKGGVGKSSVLNSIVNDDYFETNILNGFTKAVQTKEMKVKRNRIKGCELFDYPGFDICNSNNEVNEPKNILNLDLIMFIIAGDPNRNELKKLFWIINNGKKVIIIFNKIDIYTSTEIKKITKKIKRILPDNYETPMIMHSNKRNYKLKEYLNNVLEENGENLVINNTFQLVNKLIIKIKENRLIKRKKEAQTIIGKYATIKASGVALNPIIYLDMFGSFALDTILIKELSRIYGLQVKGKSAQKLLQKISVNNFFLGASQIGINLSFNIIKKLSLLSAPFTSGLSLVPYGPIALVQAALAVTTTKIIGKLAAKEMLKKSKVNGLDPIHYIQKINQKESKLFSYNMILSDPKKTRNDLSIFLP
tara:strand:+ start:1640 stop:2890 length:1251 start_codon:yes stop_codon:yes gene_type:complete